jgi:hypothetical protein
MGDIFCDRTLWTLPGFYETLTEVSIATLNFCFHFKGVGRRHLKNTTSSGSSFLSFKFFSLSYLGLC